MTRTATRREYPMCPPNHFAVTCSINPWMDPAVPIDLSEPAKAGGGAKCRTQEIRR